MTKTLSPVIRVRAALCRFGADRGGATAIEYSLIASLIAMALVGAITATGDGLQAKWTSMADAAIAAMTGS
jgi:pilus assembly protein Flp/PilA